MPVLMMRYRVADEGVAEVVDAIETAFATVEATCSAPTAFSAERKPCQCSPLT